MAKFDRYLFSQLMILFGFFSLVLVLVYWINRAVVLFDQLIANGQSAIVFLEFTALSLPNVIRLVLPMAAFAASVYVTNRLASESELVVVQATGYSPYRLARPVLVFGLVVAILVSILTHILVPTSLAQLRLRTAEISENITARLLQEGTFLHPTAKVTFYIREITPEGELLDVFMSDARQESERTNYTARRALLIQDEERPKLVMFDGMSQILDSASGHLATTSFSDFVFDISSFVKTSKERPRRPAHLKTSELLWPTQAIIEESRARRSVLLQEGHERITLALLCFVAALAGFATLMLGSYSRFGLWRQIIGAIVFLILIKSLDNAVTDIARGDENYWPLMYTPVLLGMAICYLFLWISARPGLFSKRVKAGAA